MKKMLRALVPALALVAALSLPSLAEAGHRHGPRCGHRGYHSDGYGHGHRGGHYARPYGYSRGDRAYRPSYYGYGYAAPPYVYGYGGGYGHGGYGYGGYGYGYGYYPPPPRYRASRPRVGVSLYFGF